MDLPPEERVNMSLEDLIKAKQKTKKPAAKAAANKLAGKKDAQQAGKNATKSIGQAKAKRAAAADKRRGLNETGKVSTQQLKTAVAKQQKGAKVQTNSKNVKTAVVKAKAKSNAAKSNAGGGALSLGTGLKISFKPSELNKTTEKHVASQIIGVLSKDPNFRKGAAGKKGPSPSGAVQN
ncbi:unnamed protein product, partial [Symbiodinium microadriaticum]